MARMMDDALPFDPSAPRMALGDDEIALHAEALEDGRDAPERRLWPPPEVQDDEIGRYMEDAALLFAAPPTPRPVRRRRAAKRH